MFRASAVVVVIMWFGFSLNLHAFGGPLEIFSIGSQDRSFAEFAPEREPGQPVVYRVGSSSPAQDWYAYQEGSFDYQVGRSSMEQDWVVMNPGESGNLAKDPAPVPFEVAFSLPSTPKGLFSLHLGAIFRYRRPAAPRYAVEINGKSGSYQLTPRPEPELWWRLGGEGGGGLQYIGYESLEMLLPASYFQRGNNRLTVRCLDGFGIFYDYLTLTNEPEKSAPSVAAAWVEPTALYKSRSSGLVELAKVVVRTVKPLGHSKLRVVVGSSELETEFNQNEFGDLLTILEVPAIDQTVPVAVYVSGRKAPVYSGSFTPRRKWQVYALPMEQADFGYNDVPSRTLEWENRFLDKVLEIQQEYPSYSFTLDASANLESYLATRDETHGKQLLNYLRSGKFGINALYENFFTGLATPEELFRMVEYALLAGREHGFPVDSASQTDEPSIAWALPQILSAAGVKYFSDGSDPIRGPFNPIGLLNFRSPFYWEAPDGSKVLMWSAVSYTVVDDMTWGGWNAEAVSARKYSPSLFGLEHSLPMFLSQYEREDFPFDAVLLYGLHNDEVPVRHKGNADVIQMWNQEYAFPKIIFGTQHDFFSHITEHFAPKIQTVRGDGGAYWEDEAGADARIAAMNRASQTQVSAAEKYESVANWLKPLLRFDSDSFEAAWKNLLLADCYVWSDATSFKKPYGYRTRYGEAAHRAWAEAANQQSWDLRLIAMDQISELIQSEKPGAVVFNSESWPRSGFFDFELDPDEVLEDPATGQPILCGSMKALNGYQDVRCWASNVPALGYKFYAIAKGKVPEGQSVTLDSAQPVVEGTYYKLQLDPQRGAVVHLIDKSTGLDLVNSGSGYQFNEYLYVTGGDPGEVLKGSMKDNRLLAADLTLPVPELTLNRQSPVEKPGALHYPWGTVITLHSKAMNTPEIVSTITLNDQQKQVLISNEVEKVSTLKKEGVYFAFPFAVRKPRIEYQGATAWVNPETDMLPGANRQWFTTQGGVRVSGESGSIAWTSSDAPLITLEDINRGLWPDSLQIQNGTVFSYVMNNYWYTDTPAQQGGHFTFRYGLTSGRDLSLAETTSLALEQRSPLTSLRHYHMGWPHSLPEQGAGFLSASPAGVTVLAVRPLASHDAYLVRVHNSLPQSVKATLQFPVVHLTDAYLGSVLGKRVSSVQWTPQAVELPLSRYEIQSLVVHMKTVKD